MPLLLALALILFMPLQAFSSEEGSSVEECSRRLVWNQLTQDWGVSLFKPAHPGFREPEFLELLQEAADPYLHGGYADSPRSQRLTHQITKRFHKYWAQLASQPKAKVPFQTYVLRLESSGTEANAAVVEYVKNRFRVYTGVRQEDPREPEVIYFSDIYNRGSIKATYETLPEDPLTQSGNFKFPPAPSDLVDRKNLDHLRQVFSDPNRLIAGIFLETVTNGHGSMRTFRPAFLKELRALADEFNVAIIADEIFVGLGRTGKFWSFEHFPGFVPDYVTFGKGLMLSGYAWVDRMRSTPRIHQRPRFEFSYLSSTGFFRRATDVGPSTTFAASGLSVLQASQVLKVIYDGNLVKNARVLGKYILDRSRDHNRGPSMSGIGLHLLRGSTRISPPLDITKEDVDTVLFPNRER